MMLRRAALLGSAILVLTAGTVVLAAEEPKHHSHLDALAAKLGLSADQKEKLHKIHTEFDSKEDPIESRLWALHHQEHEAISQVLTKEQREKVPQVMREQMHKAFEKVAGELGLSDDQKAKVAKIHQKYAPQYQKLAHEAHGKGEAVGGEFRKLRHEEFAAIREVLNDEQRAKAPGILREEFHRWQNPTARREALKAVGEKLGVTDEEKEKIKKIHEEYSAKIKEPAEQLRHLHQEEHKAIEAVLTADQRTKLNELHRAHGGGEHRRGKE